MSFTVKETPYFYEEDGKLYQAFDIVLDNIQHRAEAEVNLAQGEKSKSCGFTINEGFNSFRVISPGSSTSNSDLLTVTLFLENEKSELSVRVGKYKPWTIYIAQDKHLDYGWRHSTEIVVERMNELTDYYIKLHDEKESRFNFDCSIWFEEYRNARPIEKVEKLSDLLKAGIFEMGALYLQFANGVMIEEELIQGMLPIMKLEKEFGISFSSVMPNEVPSLNWGLTTVLSGCGIKHIVRGVFLSNNPNFINREPKPLFKWIGPDGSEVLVKMDVFKETDTFGGYAEAMPLRIGSYKERVSFIEEAVDRYEAYDNYQFDAILLAGTGFDDFPFDSEACDFIKWFNNQGWMYPKLVDATWEEYWKHLDRNIKTGLNGNEIEIPVQKGDWGSSWEERPAHFAYINSLFRKGRYLTLAAQTMSAIMFIINGKKNSFREDEIYNSFLELNKFCEHDFGGATPYAGYDMRDRKTISVYSAINKSSRVIDGVFADLSLRIRNDKDGVLVINTLSWERDGFVDILLNSFEGDYRVVDANTNETVACYNYCDFQSRRDNHLQFIASKVPAFGYKFYTLELIESVKLKENENEACCLKALENERYRLEVDVGTGGLTSLYDKRLKRELWDTSSQYRLNQYIYVSEENIHLVDSVKISGYRDAPNKKSLVVEGTAFRTKLKTTYTIYSDLAQVDICNELYKEPTHELQSCHFVFPFAVPDRVYHFDGTASVIRPGLVENGGDQLAGAGMGTYCGLHFADASNKDFGVTLASADAYLYNFGSITVGRTEGYIDPNNSTIYSVVMMNHNRGNHCTGQGGQDFFNFEYSIIPHEGGFKASESLKSAKSVCYPLLTKKLGKTHEGTIGMSSSFVEVDCKNVTTAGLKVSEDGNGVIFRLRECDGKDTEAEISSKYAMIISAIETDLLERDKKELNCTEGRVKVRIPALGLYSVKLAFVNGQNTK